MNKLTRCLCKLSCLSGRRLPRGWRLGPAALAYEARRWLWKKSLLMLVPLYPYPFGFDLMYIYRVVAFCFKCVHRYLLFCWRGRCSLLPLNAQCWELGRVAPAVPRLGIVCTQFWLHVCIYCIIECRVLRAMLLQPSNKLTACKLTSFGSDFQGWCLYVERFHPLKIRSWWCSMRTGWRPGSKCFCLFSQCWASWLNGYMAQRQRVWFQIRCLGIRISVVICYSTTQHERTSYCVCSRHTGARKMNACSKSARYDSETHFPKISMLTKWTTGVVWSAT